MAKLKAARADPVSRIKVATPRGTAARRHAAMLDYGRQAVAAENEIDRQSISQAREFNARMKPPAMPKKRKW